MIITVDLTSRQALSFGVSPKQSSVWGHNLINNFLGEWGILQFLFKERMISLIIENSS
jgi:hypothetical protein